MAETARAKLAIAFVAALITGLFMQGAVPFVSVPTLGQAVWTTGFSLSFLNGEGPFSIYAQNFGAPEPAAIAFGLAGALPAAFLIAAGLHPADAYAAMAAFWLSVAFVSAWRLGMKVGSRPYASLLAALLWISMPVIWAHAGYSMVSLGIALLPFYFLAAYKCFFEPASGYRKIYVAAFYLAACIISVFMDGYSFMMFAVGSSILGAYAFIFYPEHRRILLRFGFPLHAACFAVSYLLYAAYIGRPDFDAAPLDFFRGWGADVSFFLIPSSGMLWLWDALGISVPRSGEEFFGDSSVWKTTFLAPLLLTGLLAWWFTRSSSKIASGLLLVALVGLYLSLGPSLKFFSTRPAELIAAGQMSPVMPAELAIAPTGSAWISEYLPGFKNMRAAYRWSALGIFGLWFLILLWLVREEATFRRSCALALTALLLLFNLPDPVESWRSYTSNRNMFLAIDRDIRDDMREVLRPGEKVAFLPYRNDFLVNYLAPSLEIEAYNVGGDKNLHESWKNWPPLMRDFRMAQVDTGFTGRVALLLAKQEADAVVLPYIDMLWAAHSWPAKTEFKEQVEPVLAQLEATGLFQIEHREFYAVARVAPESGPHLASGALENRIARDMCLAPLCIEAKELPPDTPHQVGRYENGALHSDGRAGFLLFGPYVPLEAGKYHLVVKGSVKSSDGAWADVVSQHGQVVHGRFPVSDKEDGSGMLVDTEITIGSYADDVEVRLFVNEGSLLHVSAYKLLLD